mmetsp:Transcript_21941/g.65094  ORF Transcript_21941/g.65094 Transcript_21941/m.65094 type:complete len:201 (+) Transcript_21941:548-1150(+)
MGVPAEVVAVQGLREEVQVPREWECIHVRAKLHAGVGQQAHELAVRAIDVQAKWLAVPLPPCYGGAALVEVAADESLYRVAEEDDCQPVLAIMQHSEALVSAMSAQLVRPHRIRPPQLMFQDRRAPATARRAPAAHTITAAMQQAHKLAPLARGHLLDRAQCCRGWADCSKRVPGAMESRGGFERVAEHRAHPPWVRTTR